jgi:predicted amidohydrolase
MRAEARGLRRVSSVNLATHERGHFRAGDALPVLTVPVGGGTVRLGVQLCREIRLPGQWAALARQGADVIVYMTTPSRTAGSCPSGAATS